ncbi:hypothetical protein NDU88_003546 [Pleurodeles waltl]|uniref:Uncharacterized protein n=1 Tax=Pleurodeles waltl TaxID=8319 RepID=A0AAV7VDM1_PLEWA|nr:hypothetical protein NDU88_003546 [Pleurodeles waltl]
MGRGGYPDPASSGHRSVSHGVSQAFLLTCRSRAKLRQRWPRPRREHKAAACASAAPQVRTTHTFLLGTLPVHLAAARFRAGRLLTGPVFRWTVPCLQGTPIRLTRSPRPSSSPAYWGRIVAQQPDRQRSRLVSPPTPRLSTAQEAQAFSRPERWCSVVLSCGYRARLGPIPPLQTDPCAQVVSRGTQDAGWTRLLRVNDGGVRNTLRVRQPS